MEMAAVSFNKVRLQYYVSTGNKRGEWLSNLLKHPSTLFGTTLIGVNTAMQFGSEYARQFYSALHVSPDWAPVSQVLIVLIFAELSPMFAARRYAEHVAMLGVPLLFLASRILTPAIIALNMIVKFFYMLLGISADRTGALTREELQKAIEERDETQQEDPILQNIFALKTKTAKELMEPIDELHLISSDSTVEQVRTNLEKDFLPFMPVYQKQKKNVVGVVYPRDLLQYAKDAKVADHLRPPWFIGEKTSALQILKQFKRNSQSMAIVLNKVGLASGVVTLDSVVDEIFGEHDHWVSIAEYLPHKHHVFVERTLPGSTTIQQVIDAYKIDIKAPVEKTLEDLLEEGLGHPPEVGQGYRIGDFELILAENSLITGKMITIISV